MTRPTGDLEFLSAVLYQIVDDRLWAAKLVAGMESSITLEVTPDIPVYRMEDMMTAMRMYVKPEYVEVVEKQLLETPEQLKVEGCIPEECLTDLVGTIDINYLQVPPSIYDLPTFIGPEPFEKS